MLFDPHMVLQRADKKEGLSPLISMPINTTLPLRKRPTQPGNPALLKVSTMLIPSAQLYQASAVLSIAKIQFSVPNMISVMPVPLDSNSNFLML